MAAIKLFRRDKVAIQEVTATLVESKGIILDTVWQALWCDAIVRTGLIFSRFLLSVPNLLLLLSSRWMRRIKPKI